MNTNRPTFIGASIGLLGLSRLGTPSAAAAATVADLPAATGEMPMRRLGRTNERVSAIGLGGFHIGKSDLADGDAIKLMHGAIDRGITFFDNSWDYNMGASELRMGRALTIGNYRERVFLMTKIDGRTISAFNEQFEQSLNRLLVDHVDLVQFHENIRPDDADRIFAEDGAIHAALAAQKAGKTRFIGFTGHKTPAYHLHMIELAAKHGFTFDTVQMPLNVMDAHYDSFEKNVIPVARKLDMGIIGMKTFGDHFVLDAAALPPEEMLHYGLNLPTSVVVTGIDKPEILDQAIAAATSFKPLDPAQVAALLEKTRPLAANGKSELYKSTHFFDSTIQNPAFLG